MNLDLKLTVVYGWHEEAIKNGYRVIIHEGSSRSSKTHSLMQDRALDLMTKPVHTSTIMRDTKTSCVKIIEKEFVEFLKDPCGRKSEFEKKLITAEQLNTYLINESIYHLFKHNKSNHTIKYEPKGSILLFDGADNVDSIIGMGNDVIWINEPYSFKPEVFTQLKQRTSGLIIIDLNPKQSLPWLEELKKRDDTKEIPSTLRNNPFCPTGVKNEIMAYMPLEAKYIEGINSYKKGVCLTDEWNESFKTLKNIKELKEAKEEINKYELTDYQKKEILRGWNNERQGTARRWEHEVYALGIASEAENRIFSNWTPMSDEDYFKLDYYEFWGVDFGIYDPTTLVSIKYYDNNLYVKLHIYKPEIKMIDVNGINIPLSTYFLNNSTLTKGDHTRVICESQDNDKHSNDGKVIQLLKDGIFACKVNKPNIMERVNLLRKLKVYFVDDKEGNMKRELNGYTMEQVIRGGKSILRPDPTKPEHSLDAVGYCAWYMYENNYMSHIDLT